MPVFDGSLALPMRGVKILPRTEPEELPPHALAFVHLQAGEIAEEATIDGGADFIAGTKRRVGLPLGGDLGGDGKTESRIDL